MRHPARGRSVVIIVAVTVAAVLAAGCGGSTLRDGDSATGTVTVSAAASLQGAFAAMADRYDEGHPRSTTATNFGPSSTLVTQILDGAPVDVIATADPFTMDVLVDADRIVGEPIEFATTSLVIVVGEGNPLGIRSLDDLARPGVVYVTCAPEVPIGNYAARVLDRAGVAVRPSSYETDVRGIVAKVAAGEADAGIVYATDVDRTDPRTDAMPIAPQFDVTASYWIAQVADAPNPTAARAWIDFVIGPFGRAVLESQGFTVP